MRAAVINNGRIKNVIVLDDLSQFPGAVECPVGNIGDLYSGGVFTPAPLPPAMAKRAEAEAELQAVKTLPFIKQLRRMQRSEVVDLVQAAFPAGPQRDLIKQLALVAWVTTLNNDKEDE